ncbi:MAG: hypothetical protein IPH20_23085 [Bacteroidales bacterium]|nr:hypothetical protein [Bacteroidales bacterium]
MAVRLIEVTEQVRMVVEGGVMPAVGAAISWVITMLSVSEHPLASVTVTV